MPTVPKPQLGQHLVSVTITGQTIGNDGALANGTNPAAVTVQTVLRELNLTVATERVEINGMNSIRQNEVILSSGVSLSIGIFLVNNTTDPNPLEKMAATYDYFKVVWVVGTATGSVETHTFYGVRGNLEIDAGGRGERMATLELGPCDIGAPQYVRSVA